MVVLYIALGIIGYFSFGFNTLIAEKVVGKNGSDTSAWKKLEKNVAHMRSDDSQQSQDSFSNQESETGDH